MTKTMAWTLGLACAVVTGAAADETKTRTHPTPGSTISATGCLEKHDDPNTWELDVENGNEWVLVDAPGPLKLAEHVGHKVEVSGTVLAGGEKTADEKGISSGTGSGTSAPVTKTPSQDDRGISSGAGSGTAKMKEKKPDHRLKVTSLKMVAATCP